MRSMKKTLSVLCLCLTSGILAACGQTGPLYLPGTKPPIYVPHPKKQKPQTPAISAAQQPPSSQQSQ